MTESETIDNNRLCAARTAVLSVVACLALCALLICPAPATAAASAPATGPAAGTTILSKPNAQIPLNLTFADESGKQVMLGDYFQPRRPVLLIMVYFGCPNLCGISLNGMTDAVRNVKLEPGRDFEIVTVSFDPKEGPELAAAKKANYIKLLGKPEAAAGWHFLTSSDPSAPERLGDAIGFGYRLDPTTGNFVHETGIYICTPEGRVSRVELGSKYDPQVLHDSLINASRGQISSGLFGVALACGLMSFDEASGTYVVAAVAVMRITALLTLVGLSSGIGWMLYRESRKRAAEASRDSAPETAPVAGPRRSGN